jgi:hypothetical protein
LPCAVARDGINRNTSPPPQMTKKNQRTPTGACAGLLRLSNYDLLPRLPPVAVLWLGAAAAALEPASAAEAEVLRSPKHLHSLVQTIADEEWGPLLLEHPYASRFVHAIRAIAAFKSVMPTLMKTSKADDVTAALSVVRGFVPETHALTRHLSTLISKAAAWRVHARAIVASKGPIATSIVEAALLAARRIPVDLSDDEARLEVRRSAHTSARARARALVLYCNPPRPPRFTPLHPLRPFSSTAAARGACAAA